MKKLLNKLFKKVDHGLTIGRAKVLSITVPLVVLAGLFAFTGKQQAAIYTFENFFDPKVAALAIQYGTTNYVTNQTVTNGLGFVSTNGWYWYQNMNVTPTVVQGTGLTFVGYPPSGTVIGGGSAFTTNAISPIFVNPFLYSLYGTNSYYAQWLAGQTNANGSSIISPVLLGGCKVFADANGDITSNVAVTITATADGTKATNNLNITFVRVTPLPPSWLLTPNANGGGTPNYDTNNPWTVSVALNGTNQVTIITNVPAYMMQGASAIVPWHFDSQTNLGVGTYNGTNIYINQLSMSGQVP